MNRRTLLALAPQLAFFHGVQPLWLFARQPDTRPVFSVREQGAQGDGHAVDTIALQKTIDLCAKNGGGIVRFERGTYLTGSLFLRSHVTLQLDKDATILGSANLKDYATHASPDNDVIAGVGGHLISAVGAEDIGIVGEGKIDGSGTSFWVPNPKHRKPAPDKEWTDVAMFGWQTLPHPGPMISLTDCRHVRFTDVKLTNSTAWTVRLYRCNGVEVHGVMIDNPRYGPNTDGIDVVCTSNVEITDCHIKTGDDAICLKSEGPATDLLPTRNVKVRGCTVDTNCNGLKIGTGTQGIFENIVFEDCELSSDYPYVGDRMISAIAIEMVDGGRIDGFIANDIRVSRARTPIFVRLGNRGTGQTTPVPGSLRNVRISNVTATGAIATSSIMGIPGHPVQNITLEDIHITSEEAGPREWLERAIPEVENGYPEARMFGRLPASGLYCRHVQGLDIAKFSIHNVAPDFRPALNCEDVDDLKISSLGAEKPKGLAPVVELENVRRASLEHCTAPTGTDVYLSIGGDSDEVTVSHCDLHKARTPIRKSGARTSPTNP